MKANTKTAKRRMPADHRSAALRSLAPLLRMSFILATAAVACLMTAGAVWASVPETGNQLIQASPVTSQADFRQAKTLAHTDAGQTVQAPAFVAQVSKYQQVKTLANTDADQAVRAPVIVGKAPAPNAAASDSPLVAAIVLGAIAVAACLVVAFGLRRNRPVGRPAAAASPRVVTGVGRENRKAA
jgi:hypothetical protein